MRSGDLRHRLTIEQPTTAADALGQPIQTWTPYATVFGSLLPLSGRERFLAAQTVAETTHRARIRYLSGVTAKMRVAFAGKVYQITYVADDNRGRELVLDLQEGVIDG